MASPTGCSTPTSSRDHKIIPLHHLAQDEVLLPWPSRDRLELGQQDRGVGADGQDRLRPREIQARTHPRLLQGGRSCWA